MEANERHCIIIKNKYAQRLRHSIAGRGFLFDSAEWGSIPGTMYIGFLEPATCNSHCTARINLSATNTGCGTQPKNKLKNKIK